MMARLAAKPSRAPHVATVFSYAATTYYSSDRSHASLYACMTSIPHTCFDHCLRARCLFSYKYEGLKVDNLAVWDHRHFLLKIAQEHPHYLFLKLEMANAIKRFAAGREALLNKTDAITQAQNVLQITQDLRKMKRRSTSGIRHLAHVTRILDCADDQESDSMLYMHTYRCYNLADARECSNLYMPTCPFESMRGLMMCACKCNSNSMVITYRRIRRQPERPI